MAHTPITVAIERAVDPERIDEATIWVQAGTNLANKYPGFLGSGWVRQDGESEVWHMLYRFADADTLDAWENSRERRWWLASGTEFMAHRRTERRSGIEGWFDAPLATSVESIPATAPVPVVVVPPPRWKQATTIWLGFFPANLLFTVLVSFLPGWAELHVVLRVLISTALLTPIMTYWLLPLVTRWLRPWLQRRRD